MRTATPFLLLTTTLLCVLAPPPTLAQPGPGELVTSALVRPHGVTTDAQGRIWVAETGTAPDADDGRVSVVLPDGQVFPFLTGIPTGINYSGTQRSVTHLLLVGDDLWFTATVSDFESSLYRISTAGWSPGDPPRTMADVAETVDVGKFLIGGGFDVTDPFGLALGPDGALYVADAGADALLRYDPATGVLSVLVTFPDLPNPTPPPSFVDAFPTGVEAADGRLYVALAAGLPFIEGLAQVYAVEFDGTYTVHHDGLTALSDLARDPRDGALTVLSIGTEFGTGWVVRLADGRELASNLDHPRGMAYDAAGALYVAELTGHLYRVDSAPVANEPASAPAGSALHAARPNPFDDATTLVYELGTTAHVRLAVYDVLGREVVLLVDGVRSAGRHEAVFDPGRAGIPGGVYTVSLSGAGSVLSRRVTFVR